MIICFIFLYLETILLERKDFGEQIKKLTPVKRVVSVSLGSSRRDKKVNANFQGEEFSLERIGTDGDLNKAISLIRELDGKVDAITLGGIDLYLYAVNRRYIIRDALKLAKEAKITPVVDGSGLKNTLERDIINRLHNEDILPLSRKKVLLVSGVDRFGMAEAFTAFDCQIIFGDLIFALGIPIPIKSINTLSLLARILLPVICRLPFKFLYPTGERQEKIRPKYSNYYSWAEIIAGDFLIIKRYLPPKIEGKIIITNTTTEEDIILLKQRGAKNLITTTPRIQGRSFGTNVMEGVIITLLGKKPTEVTPDDYIQILKKLNWEITVEQLN